MTTGANALLAWFRQPLAKIRTTTDKTTHASPRQYRTHARRTCYRCRQEGHYAKDCPRATAPKPTETKMEKMQSLLRSMTPNEQAQFKREISPQMTAMQTHLRTMTTPELREFKKQIAPNTTQRFATALRNAKTTTNPLSRETSPRTDQTFTGTSPSRETGPHPAKSMKKLAQALKRRTKYETERRARTPHPNHSQKMLAEALKNSTKVPHPEPPTKMLADALVQYNEQKNKHPTRTYAERIRELIGSPEQCAKCGKEHPTRLCMKQFEKLRKPETIPLLTTDDDSTNSNTLCDSEESDDETEPIADLTKSMKKLSLIPAKSVTFDLPTDRPLHLTTRRRRFH